MSRDRDFTDLRRVRAYGTLALGALITLLIPRFARAQGAQNAECVLDSECAAGRQCIDLVCVPATRREDTVHSGTQSSTRSRPESRTEGTPLIPPVVAPQPKEQPRPALQYRPWETAPPQRSDTGVVEVAQSRPRSVWYGGPLIATYSLTAVVGTVTFTSGSGGALLFLTAFSSPTVHWANRKVGKGFLSLLMQPVAAGAGYLAAGDSTNDAARAAGTLLGYTLWAVIDVAALAYKSPPEPEVKESSKFGVGLFRVAKGGGAEVFGVW